MAKRPQDIKISAKLIEFEDHIIRVPNIASVTIGPDPALRLWAKLLFVVAFVCLLMLYILSATMGGMGRAFQYDATAPVLLFVAVGALATGIYLFNRKALFISKSDSRFTLLTDKNPAFMRDVMARIREALLAGEASHIVYQVNVQAERIERLDASTTSTTVTNSAGATVVGGAMSNSTIGMAGTSSGASASMASVNGLGAALSGLIVKAKEQGAPAARVALDAARGVRDRLANGHANGHGIDEAGSVEHRASPSAAAGPAPHPAPAHPAPTAVHQTISHAPGAIMVGGGVSNSAIGTHVQAAAIADFDAAMALLMRHPLGNNREIADYLRPVRDHLEGGPTPREDALQRWGWIAAQAAGVLSGLDGLASLVGKVARALGR